MIKNNSKQVILQRVGFLERVFGIRERRTRGRQFGWQNSTKRRKKKTFISSGQLSQTFSMCKSQIFPILLSGSTSKKYRISQHSSHSSDSSYSDASRSVPILCF